MTESVVVEMLYLSLFLSFGSRMCSASQERDARAALFSKYEISALCARAGVIINMSLHRANCLWETSLGLFNFVLSFLHEFHSLFT
jgi:hypothetical protein